MSWILSYALAKKKAGWKEIKNKLATEGAQNVIYDSNLDNVVEQADYASTAGDADTVDGQHASAFELVANKGVANGYAPLDANAQVPVANLPDAVKTSNLVDQTANRALNTVYQNTSGKYLLVMVSVYVGTGTSARAQAWISSDNITYNPVGMSQTTDTAFVAFVAPPNYYYKVDSLQGNSIYSWWEVTI